MMFERATHIEVEAKVRYWEDARVDGVEDADGAMIHGRAGDLWKCRIGLADGKIEGWPPVEARIHYKVSDEGEYWLTDPEGHRLAKWKSFYVPDDFLCHGGRGFGDYIIMVVRKSGHIEDYERPAIINAEWMRTL